jgi:hypothetical protein
MGSARKNEIEGIVGKEIGVEMNFGKLLEIGQGNGKSACREIVTAGPNSEDKVGSVDEREGMKEERNEKT